MNTKTELLQKLPRNRIKVRVNSVVDQNAPLGAVLLGSAMFDIQPRA